MGIFSKKRIGKFYLTNFSDARLEVVVKSMNVKVVASEQSTAGLKGNLATSGVGASFSKQREFVHEQQASRRAVGPARDPSRPAEWSVHIDPDGGPAHCFVSAWVKTPDGEVYLIEEDKRVELRDKDPKDKALRMGSWEINQDDVDEALDHDPYVGGDEWDEEAEEGEEEGEEGEEGEEDDDDEEGDEDEEEGDEEEDEDEEGEEEEGEHVSDSQVDSEDEEGEHGPPAVYSHSGSDDEDEDEDEDEDY